MKNKIIKKIKEYGLDPTIAYTENSSGRTFAYSTKIGHLYLFYDASCEKLEEVVIPTSVFGYRCGPIPDTVSSHNIYISTSDVDFEKKLDRALYIATHELEFITESYLLMAKVYRKLLECKENLDYYGYAEVHVTKYTLELSKRENRFASILVKFDPFRRVFKLLFHEEAMVINEDTDSMDILTFISEIENEGRRNLL